MSDENQWRQALDAGLAALDRESVPTVDDAQREQLIRFLSLLHKWNRVYNLTAVRDVRQMVDRHLLDSLVMSRWLPPESIAPDRGFDVMDIGTGAGLPVLPLAMVRPDLRFLSVESVGKKTRFQQQVVLELALDNVRVRHDRIQNVSDQAALVTSRAFTAPEDFLQIARPLCLPAGQVAIMLGHAERLPAELPAGFQLQELVAVQVPGTDSARHVALCQRQHG